MTSNIGVKELDVTPVGFGADTTSDMNVNDVIAKSLKKVFRPEFINRIDEKVVFNSLKEEDIMKIVEIHIESLRKRMKDNGEYQLTVTKRMKDFLLKESYSEEFGARPVIRAVTKFIQNPASKAVLKGEVKQGDKISVDYNIKKEEVIVKKVK